MLVLVILFFVVLWNFDLRKTLHVKMVSQNGGDSAALMAARWQGITLNLVGDLNIMRALAISVGDMTTESSVSNLQARLAFVGPMIGFMGAQQAAKNNGVFQNDEFTRAIRDHAAVVRIEYPTVTAPDGTMLFPEPYEGAWQEYADMLELVANNGVAVAPENAHFYSDYASGHMLLGTAFYDAVQGRNWCWFYHSAMDLLETYTDYMWWAPLPPVEHVAPVNSEIYGVGLAKHFTSLDSLVERETLDEAAESHGLDTSFSPTALATNATWYCYASNWRQWDAISPNAEFPFPATGPVRPQYDYSGADAGTRIEASMALLTPGVQGATVSNTLTWTSAAKPFGYLGEDLPPHSFGLILPAFHDVRLIALDLSSIGAGGGFELCWRHHIGTYLPAYMDSGPSACTACRYCDALHTWEDPAFRNEGLAWLAANTAACIAPPGGPCGPGGGGGGGRGGSRRGH
jgi:hypothetical protein